MTEADPAARAFVIEQTALASGKKIGQG